MGNCSHHEGHEEHEGLLNETPALDGLRVLKPEGDPVQSQLVRQALLRGRFEQARPEFPVNSDRTADSPARYLVENHPSCPFVLFVVGSVPGLPARRPVAAARGASGHLQ
jgi:hypothetical protein